jgi:hypothetical protein
MELSINNDVCIKIGIVVILLYFIIYNLCIKNDKSKIENMINISDPIPENPKYGRNKCDYYMNKTIENVLVENKINNTSENDWDVYFPCGYDDIDKEINEFIPKSERDKIFIIHNADNLAAKDELWKFIKLHNGIDRAKTMMPPTYILTNKNDLVELENDFNSNKSKLYIMKKNEQRQEGLRITDDLKEILSGRKYGYVIAQQLLQDPYLINKRKINMRVYILVICNNGNFDVYVYNDGFMYYTKDEYKQGNKLMGPNITTGYIDRKVYDVNPLTHKDFKTYLDKTDRNLTEIEVIIRKQGLNISDLVFSRINDLVKNIFMSFPGNICNGGKLDKHLSFQLFGADVAVNNELWPSLMEINKGPDLSAKDDRDGKVKSKCIRDMFKIIGVLPKNHTDENGFIKVLDIENGKINKI